MSRSRIPIAEANRRDAHNLVTVTATVRNTGSRDGTEVVQCYVRNLGASLEQPVRSLEGFERVRLKPGESKQVSFKLGFPELSFYDNSGRAVIEQTDYTVWVGGSSRPPTTQNFVSSLIDDVEAHAQGTIDTRLNLLTEPPRRMRRPSLDEVDGQGLVR